MEAVEPLFDIKKHFYNLKKQSKKCINENEINKNIKKITFTLQLV